MKKIENIDELGELKLKISMARDKCKKALDYKRGFLSGKTPLIDDYKAHNEAAYASLPKEIEVSTEIGQLLISLYVDHLQAKATIEDSFQPGRSALNAFGSFLATIIAPSPATIGALALALAENEGEFRKRKKSLEELTRRVDDSMQSILGSYQLIEKNGNLVLKRGSWDVFGVERMAYRGQFSSTYTEYFPGVNDVGVDKKLLPTEKRYLADKFKDPENSPNVGRW